MAQNEPQHTETPPGPSPNSPSLLFEYQRRSGKFIRLANRIESFLPELECSTQGEWRTRCTAAPACFTRPALRACDRDFMISSEGGRPGPRRQVCVLLVRRRNSWRIVYFSCRQQPMTIGPVPRLPGTDFCNVFWYCSHRAGSKAIYQAFEMSRWRRLYWQVATS